MHAVVETGRSWGNWAQRTVTAIESSLSGPQLNVDAELSGGLNAVQATIEKASIDEVYIDVTAMVDKELQVLVPLTCCTLLPESQELTETHDNCRDGWYGSGSCGMCKCGRGSMQAVFQSR